MLSHPNEQVLIFYSYTFFQHYYMYFKSSLHKTHRQQKCLSSSVTEAGLELVLIQDQSIYIS